MSKIKLVLLKYGPEGAFSVYMFLHLRTPSEKATLNHKKWIFMQNYFLHIPV